MPDFVLAIMLKPLVIVALFGTAILLARLVMRAVPPGKIRNILMMSINRRQK
jgi:hypothetical protein